MICGVAVDRNGPSSVLYVGFVGIVLLVPFACCCRRPKRSIASAGKHAPFGILDLLRSRPFLLFMIAAGFCQASHAVLYSFGTLTWRAAGIDDVTISLLWGESVAVEIVLMLVSGWLLARLGVYRPDRAGLGCGMVRWLGMAFTTELWALVLLQALHAGTFAACHLGAMAFIQRALPASGAALGQSVYYALGTGATQAVIFQFAGVLYGEFGQKAFLGMFVVSAIGMAALVALARAGKARCWSERNQQLGLRRLGGLGRLHRRPLRHDIVPGCQFRRDIAPFVTITPALVSAGDGNRDLGEIERGAEMRQAFLQGGETPELPVPHLADEVVRPLVFGAQKLGPPRDVGLDDAAGDRDVGQRPPSRRSLARQQPKVAKLAVDVVADRMGVGQGELRRDQRRNAHDRSGLEELGPMLHGPGRPSSDHLVCTNSKRSSMPSSRIATRTLLTQGEAGVT